MPQVEAVFGQLLDGCPSRPADQHPCSGTLDLGCSSCWPGLLAGKQGVQRLALAAEQRYKQAYEQHGEIDERDLLATDLAALASPKLVAPVGIAKPPLMPGGGGGAALALSTGGGGGGRKLALGLLQSPLPLLQLGQAACSTPITSAMSAVAWLRQQTGGTAPEPGGPSLERYFAAAGPDAGGVVRQRVQEAAAAVFALSRQEAAPPGAGPAATALQGLPGLQEGYAKERREEVSRPASWRGTRGGGVRAERRAARRP